MLNSALEGFAFRVALSRADQHLEFTGMIVRVVFWIGTEKSIGQPGYFKEMEEK
jgi:hypothetical protein